MSRTDAVDVSVIIGFKDWGVDRLRLAVESLHASFGELRGEVIVSDYGSSACPEARGVVEEAGGRHVYTETDGIWSRSRALNAGIAASTGRVVVTTDADMLFSPRAIEVIGRRVIDDPCEALVLQCRDLPTGMGSDWVAEHGLQWQTFSEASTLRPRWGMGGMMAVSRDAFLDVRGFDERMQIYGGEDLDFAQRVRRAGRRVSWIEDPQVRMYHMWHPSSRTAASETPEGLAAIEYNRDILLNDRSVVRNTVRWRHRPPDAPPVATVVIATRNRASLLPESIHSALAQTVGDIDVLVVDDESEDDTRAVVESIDDPRLRYLQSPRRGIAAARNHAATQTRSRYTVVHDDDDMMMPDRIEHHLAALEAGDSGTYGGWVDFDDTTGEVVAVNRGKPYSLAALLFSDRVYAHATLMLETRLIHEVGYDERFRSGSDYNLAVRLARLGVSMRHTGQIHLVRRLHSGQVTHQDSSTQQSAGRWTTAAALGLIPGERQASVRAATRELAPVDVGLDDEAVAKLIRPYLPDSLVTRDLHVVLDEDVDPDSVPGLTEIVTVEDLLHGDRADLVCGVLRTVTWADLAAVSGRGRWDVLRSRPRHGRPAAVVPVAPAEHLRRLGLHVLESLPTTQGALVVGHSDLVDSEASYLLGHWRIGEQETYLVAMPAGQELVNALRETGDHEIRLVKPVMSSRNAVKAAGKQAVHRVVVAPPRPRPGDTGKKKKGVAAPPHGAAPRRGAGRRSRPTRRDEQPTGAGPNAGNGRRGRDAPLPEPPRRRLVTRRRVLVAGVASTAVVGGAGVGLMVGGAAAAVAVAAGVWLACATAALLVLLLRALDSLRRVEEAEQSSTRRLRKVVETQTGRTLRETQKARVVDREHVEAQHRQLAGDIARQVNEQQRAETKRVTSAVLSGVSDTAAANAESIGRLITQLRDRVAPLESLAGLDEAVGRTSRQVAESTREQEAQLRRLATDYEREIRDAERRLVEVITSRLSEEHRGETRRAVTELLDGLTRTSQSGADRVSGLVVGLDDRISALSGPLKAVDGRMAGLEPRLANLDRQVTRVHEELGERVRSSMASSTEQVLAGLREATEKTSATVGEAAAGLDERVAGLAGPLSAVDERVAGLEPRLDGLDRQVAAAQEELGERVRSSTASSTEQVLAGLREATEKTSATVGEAAAGLDERVAGLAGPLSAVDERVAGLEPRLDGLDRQVAAAQEELGERVRSSTASSTEQVLAGLREATEKTSATVGEAAAGLDERVAGLAGPLSAVDERVAGLEPRLDGLDRQVAAAQEELGERVRSSTASSTEQVLAGLREATEKTSATVGEAAAGLDERVAGVAGPLSSIDQRVAEALRQQEALGKATRELPGAVEWRTRLQLMRHLDQVQALVNLFQVVPARSAAPQLGGWAAAPDVLLRVVDELLIRQPKLVVECGSGASTVWLAMVVREFGLPTRIVALEHDEHFAEATRRQLGRHDVTEHAEVRVAELAELADVAGLPDHPTPWYDVAAVEDLSDIGLLFVDGPPGDTGKLARLPAVPVLRKQLADTCTIVLDDHHRPEEQAVAEHWREMLDDFDYEVLDGDKGAVILSRQARA